MVADFRDTMRNDSILSTPDVSFVRLFWSQGNPRISSVTLRGQSSVISPRPCLLVPAGVFEIRKNNQNFLLTERRSKLRDGGHRWDYQGWWRMHTAHTAHTVSHERPSKYPSGLQSSGSAANGCLFVMRLSWILWLLVEPVGCGLQLQPS